MNWKTWFPLVLAVGLALIAAKLTHDVIAGKKAGNSQIATGLVQVVVCRADLPPGAALTRDNLTLAPLPGSVPPPHTYTSVDDLIDRVTTQPLVQGQPINERLLAPKGSGTGLAALIPSGMRAVTLEVNEFTGLAGMASPGMTVDVVATFRDDATRETVTRTVVQNVKIAAVGPRMTAADTTAANPNDPPKEPYKSVTLIATPRDAEKCELAAFVGRPRLELRGGRDNASVASAGARLSELTMNASRVASSSSDWFSSMMSAARKAQAMNTSANWTSTTQPSVIPVSADPFETKTFQRNVKIIRNGVESNTVFELARPRPADMMTDMPTGSATEGK